MRYTTIVRKWVIVGLLFVFSLVGIVFASLSPYRLPRAKHYKTVAQQMGKEYDVSSALLMAIANAESGFDAAAVSYAGAVGLMQIMPETAQWICIKMGVTYTPDMLYDPAYSMRLAAWYIRYLLHKFELEYAVCAYNAGEGNVSSWLKDERYSKDGISLSSCPFSETNNYIKKINASLKVYSQKT